MARAPGRSDEWLDFLEAPLNPCSIETLPEPLVLRDGSSCWPLMLSCYQLKDAPREKQQQRLGQLNLYMVKVPDVTAEEPSFPLSFGEPHVVLQPGQASYGASARDGVASGILDGKWSPMPGEPDFDKKSWSFATAHSSGEIKIHGLHVAMGEPNAFAEEPDEPSDPPYRITYEGKSHGAPRSEALAPGSQTLCLSLNWDAFPDPMQQNRIVSSYSNGTVAIHDVIRSNGAISIIESDSWLAHSMFNSPMEVWSVCFADKCFDAKAVVSCGDEGSCKVWDIRATNRPAQVLKHFDAGITCVAPHPRQEHMLVVGSYDETLCLYDTRYFRPLCQSPKLGGGIWRVKWHPYTNQRILVAVMHGGARVINIKGFQSYLKEFPCDIAGEESQAKDSPSHFISSWAVNQSTSSLSSSSNMHFKVTKEFRAHESMCYGADWLVLRHPTHKGSYFEAAVTCSFYDKATYLWDSTLARQCFHV